MKIIISPAKKMRQEVAGIDALSKPVFLKQTRQLSDYLKTLTLPELKKLLACNDQLAALNYERFQHMDLNQIGEPALWMYEGIQYRYMAVNVFDDAQIAYAQEHLRILSGFYGVLKPMDGIVPYRLEMQAKLKTDFCENLYDFWKDALYEELSKDKELILNLASEEYSRCISRYRKEPIQLIQVIFGEEQTDGSIKEKGVYAKMARGEMVRYLCEHQIDSPDEIKAFDRLHYQYDEKRSNEQTYVFVR